VSEWQFEYTLSDHLGNTRVLFSDLNGDGSINPTTEVLQENHYYPFGMEMEGEWTNRQPETEQRYRYNGKELSPELGLYDYGARWYDPTTARWTTVDPLAEDYMPYSPYNYTLNNPILNIDPDGRSVQTTIVDENEDGTYTVVDWVDDGSTDVVTQDGTKVGESLTTHSFVNEHNEPVKGAVIDLSSTEGQDFIDQEIVADDPAINHYKANAKLNEHYDFKSRDLPKNSNEQEALIHRTRGSVTKDGKFASARDFGNMAAGIVAGRAGVPHSMAKKAFNDLQGGQEPPVSAKAQQIGLNMGTALGHRDGRMRMFLKSGGM
jgi:RHS repeat-associated protein